MGGFLLSVHGGSLSSIDLEGYSLLGLELLLPGRWKEDIVQDEPIPGRVVMQIQIRGWIPDLMLRIFGIVPAEKRPGSLSKVTV